MSQEASAGGKHTGRGQARGRRRRLSAAIAALALLAGSGVLGALILIGNQGPWHEGLPGLGEERTQLRPSPNNVCNPADVPYSLTAGNLIGNPSAEDDTDAWRRLRLDGSELQVTVDYSTAHTGKCSLRLDRRLTDTDCPSTCGYWTKGPIPVDESKIYEMSVWVKGSFSLDTRASLLVHFRWLDSTGRVLLAEGTGTRIGVVWTEYSTRIGPNGADGITLSFPKGTASVLLSIDWVGVVTQDLVEGQIWIDDAFFGLSR